MLSACDFNPLGGAELLVGGVWLGVATVTAWVLRQHPFFGKPHFILCNFAMLWWLAMALAELATPVLACKMFFSAAAWPAIALLPTAWALFLLHYCFHLPIRHRRAEAALLWGTVLGVSLMAWTNPWHGLFYGPGTTLAWIDGRLSGLFDHGPLFYAAAAWLYVPLLTALGVVVTGAFRAPAAHRPYFLLLLFITAIPLAANAAYITRGATVAGFDPTPFAFAVVLVLYTGLIFTNRMFDLTAIARDVLYYQLPSPVLVVDGGGAVIGANPEARRLFPEGRLGAPLAAWPEMAGFATPGAPPATLHLGSRVFDVTTTLLRKPLGGSEAVIGRVILLNDTTALRGQATELEAALSVSQLRLREIESQRRLLRSLFDLAPFGIALAETATGRLREANPGFAAITGRPAAQGEPLGAALGPVPAPPVTGRLGPLPLEIRRPDGSLVLAELHAMAAGGGLHWTLLADVTETRALQDALRAERDFLSRLMATSVSAILVADGEGRLIFANAEAERLLGLDATAILGLRCDDPRWQPMTPEGAPLPFEALPVAQVLRTGAAVRDHRLAIARADGERRILSVNAAPMHGTAGMPGRVVCAVSDITERWESEAALVAARQEAEAASIAKSRFLANMSHEIRTPMNAILGLLALLRRTSLDARQADYVLKTEGAARALLGLLDDILDFSKVEAGKIALDPRPVALDDMLRELGVILAANLGAKPIELLFDLDPGLPPLVQADDLRLAQVLLNLAGNAIKFTEAGEVVVSVRRQDAAPGAEAGRVRLEFAVRDTGIGIAPDNIARIFEGFLQAEASTTRKFGGTGLGLGISQRLVALMGGVLQVESTPGRGSRFHFTLEMAAPEAPPRAAGPARRLLFLDPHPTARAVLPRLAAALGWAAEAVADAAAARDRLAAGGFDALLVEGPRPGAAWPDAIGMGRVHDAERFAAEGGRPGRFLVKPFTPAMLREVVEGAAAPARPAAPAGAPRLSGRRLLLVEDNAINQQVARELLEAEGAAVTVAGHGGIAVQRLEEAPDRYDAVLMDLQMPEMDGLEATAIIRGRLGLSRLPIIAITANAMRSDREACLAAGMNAHVGKPFDLETLVQALLACWAGAPPPEAPPEPPPAEDAPPLLDIPAAIGRLGGQADLFAEMLREALPMIAASPGEIAAEWRAGKAADARRGAHTLKGLAGMAGAPRLAAAAARLEAQLKAEPERAPDAALAALEREVAPALAALGEWLAEAGA